MILNIKSLDRLTVACVRHVGPYETCEEAWGRLLRWADEQRLDPKESMFLGICHDDPALEDSDEIRYDACITVPSGTVPGEGIVLKEIGGIDYGSFLHCGPYDCLADAYNRVQGDWMAHPRPFAQGPSIEIYWNDPRKTPSDQLVTEVCIPLE
jgi:AraC family transcriptional regulator